jgi:uncharacterized protein YggT (Ycf19 family)
MSDQPTADYNAPRPPVHRRTRSQMFTLRTEEVLLMIGRAVAIIGYIWLFVVDILLALRVFMLAFSANPNAPIARFVYRTTADMMAPFRGLFPPHPIDVTGYLDVSALFAIFIYTLLVYLVGWLVNLLSYQLAVVEERIDEPEVAP